MKCNKYIIDLLFTFFIKFDLIKIVSSFRICIYLLLLLVLFAFVLELCTSLTLIR